MTTEKKQKDAMAAPTTSLPKKWLRRASIAVAAFVLVLTTLYESSTHVVRGWLRSEAFFEGRPTSYWRQEVDCWIDRHTSSEEAERCEWRIHVHFNPHAQDEPCPNGSMRQAMKPQRGHLWEIDIRYYPRATMWERAERWWHRNPSDPRPDPELPLVLSGLKDASGVLTEMEAEERYQPFVQRALQFAKLSADTIPRAKMKD